MLVSLLAVMVIVMGSVGLAAHWVSEHETDEIFSARLATSARVLEALLARQLEKATIEKPIEIRLPKELENRSGDEKLHSGHPYESKIAFQVWTDDGRLLAKSATAPDLPLGPRVSGFHAHWVGHELWQVFALPSKSVWIFAAELNEVRDEISAEISVSILMPLLAGGGVLLFLVNFLALRAIRPVEDLAQRIAERKPDSLDPIVLPDMPSELQPVILELNDLLDRVEKAFAQEQRFIDAAAHELRTPIAALHLHLQNAASGGSPQEVNTSVGLALEASRRAAKLADQLLFFSRVSSQAASEERSKIDLHHAVSQVSEMMGPIFEGRGQTLKILGEGHPMVSAEPIKMHRLIQNLLENASQYGDVSSTIEVTVSESSGWIEMHFDNPGEPIPENEREMIFKPHFRGQHSSHRVGGGGLGLAIVLEIAQQHGGSVSARDRPQGRGSRITVRLPSARVASDRLS
jgi:two-component system sensor histidine kinase QseC